MRIEGLTFGYADRTIFDGLTLDIPDGQVTAIVGGSGVGKSTLLNLLAGLLSPTMGDLPKVARCGYIFQQPRLLPTATVRQNLLLTAPKGTPTARIDEWLDKVQLTPYARYYPHELSGGMAQRVAMARAMLAGGELLLMDEPFAALDVALTAKLHKEFVQLWQEQHPTCVLVSHDLDEALHLAQNIVVLGGNPAQVVYQATVSESERSRIREEVLTALQ